VTRALQIASLAAPGEHRELLAEAGLACLEVQDLSAGVERSIGETVKALAGRRARLEERYGAELVGAMERLLPELRALYGQKLGYVLVVARKPVAR
jgi:hypothetical protein